MSYSKNFENLIDSSIASLFETVIEVINPALLTDLIRITNEYSIATEMSSLEKLNVIKLVKNIESFYDKIIALYLFKGDTLNKKKLNFVNPYTGREHFEMKFTSGVLDVTKGIRLPPLDTVFASTFVNPYDLSDFLNQGFFYYSPDIPGGSDWVVGCVADDGTKPYHNQISYHPNTGGSGNDYLEIMSDGILYPSRRAAGFTSLRRKNNTAIININGVETTHGLSTNFYQDYYSTKNWSKIALIGGSGTAYTVSVFGIYQSLTDNEHETLRLAIMRYLAVENKL